MTREAAERRGRLKVMVLVYATRKRRYGQCEKRDLIDYGFRPEEVEVNWRSIVGSTEEAS